MEARLQAAEMWFLRRIMKISWVDKISNDEVLLRANTTRQLVQTTITRQIRFDGHVIRKGKLEYLMLTGKIEGKRARGRQRLTFLGWLERSTGINPLDLITKLQK